MDWAASCLDAPPSPSLLFPPAVAALPVVAPRQPTAFAPQAVLKPIMHNEPRPGYHHNCADDSQMLDRLNDIPLKGFPEMFLFSSYHHVHIYNIYQGGDPHVRYYVPTHSRPAPRPPAPRGGSQRATPSAVPVSYLFPDAPMVVPGAPRMKDYDSFTEGSAVGSFDSIAAAETNEFGEPIYPISALALASLPHHDPADCIEQWRQGVEDQSLPEEPEELADMELELVVPRNRPPTQPLPTPTLDLAAAAAASEASTTPTNTKRPRPRSNGGSDDDARRNRRARAGTPPSPTPRVPTNTRARAQSFSSASTGILNSFLWVDRGPPPNARRRPTNTGCHAGNATKLTPNGDRPPTLDSYTPAPPSRRQPPNN
ncbi:hypothetical protein C8R46DRAFT_1258430, partial [Mycena filopes]